MCENLPPPPLPTLRARLAYTLRTLRAPLRALRVRTARARPRALRAPARAHCAHPPARTARTCARAACKPYDCTHFQNWLCFFSKLVVFSSKLVVFFFKIGCVFFSNSRSEQSAHTTRAVRATPARVGVRRARRMRAQCTRGARAVHAGRGACRRAVCVRHLLKRGTVALRSLSHDSIMIHDSHVTCRTIMQMQLQGKKRNASMFVLLWPCWPCCKSHPTDPSKLSTFNKWPEP